MQLKRIPYTELENGQSFLFEEGQRKLRVFNKAISLAGNDHATAVGHESLIFYNGCNQQPMESGQEVFIPINPTS